LITQYSITPGVLRYDFTDHYPVFVTAFTHLKISHRCKDEKLHRPLTNFYPEANLYFFLNNMPNVNADNLNPIFEQFYAIITETINQHAPLRKLSHKQKCLCSKPWITKGLLTSIKNKQKMNKSHYLHGTEVQRYLYKIYANKLTKVKEIAKKHYYHHQLQINKNNSKHTWEILRSLLPSKNKKIGSHILKNNLNGNLITDSYEIAQEINSFLTGIGIT